MNLLTQRVLLAAGLPCLLAILFYWLRGPLQTTHHPLANLLPYLPYLLAAIGMLLSWGFRNARDFHLLLLIALIFAGLQQLLWTPLAGWNSHLFISAVYLLLPLNLILHNLLKDRGIMSSHGLWRFVLTTLQTSIVIWFVRDSAYDLHFFFNYLPSDWPLQRYTPITFLGVMSLLLGMLLFSVQTIIQHSVLHAGRWAMFLMILLALHNTATPWLSALYFSLATLAILIAIVLNSYNLAYLDELTHLPSRRALKQHLMNLGRRYTLAVVDIDHFKKINDNHGHDVGDQVLRMVATHLRKVHGGGRAYRFGGEEFVIVFQGKDAGEALLMLESLRERIANSPFIQRSRLRPRKRPNKPRPRARVQHIDVTVSIGVAEKSTHHDTAQDVLKSADKALYRAKKTGRNKVCA